MSRIQRFILSITLLAASASNSYAQFVVGTMPWDGWLARLLANITGPTMRAFAVLLLIGVGFSFAASDGSAFRKLLAVAFGISIAFAAATWGPGFLGYVGP